MSKVDTRPHANELIEALPRLDRARLLKLCDRVPLRFLDVLSEPTTETRYVYFPIEGYISLVAKNPDAPGVEAGMIGTEGMLGAHLLLGVNVSPLHSLVQGPGEALRVDAANFRLELARSADLRQILGRYVYVLMMHLVTSATCLRFHYISPRLARWLLMSHDRARSDTFCVTQEFLAYMLGVRRVSITTAAIDLRRNSLISYSRGRLMVLDRPGLEKAACSCYASDRAYAALLARASATRDRQAPSVVNLVPP